MKSLGALAMLFGSSNGKSRIDLQAGDVVPNSCVGLEDGTHYVKLLEGDEYPLIQVQCSNGYMMIQHEADMDWKYYFSSFEKWHREIGGPSHMDHVNWAEWYLPNDDNTNYIIAPKCGVCDEDAQTDMRNTQGLQSGYYMNANIFGCFVYPRGMPACDFNINTYECRACVTTTNFQVMFTVDFDDPEMTDMGACMTWIRGAYDEVDRTFDECTDATDNGFKPTIGLKSQFCVCTKPSATQYFEVTEDMITQKEESLAHQEYVKIDQEKITEELSKKTADDNTVYLTKESFARGTFRIMEAGTYILTEDVEFDWNAGTKEEPNADGAWFPFENDADYPGYGTSRDMYFMGFFAGITVEADNVIIDLNGHELKQSKAFFYQQGFFSTIEVESQPFMPGQGVGFFGSDPKFPENVIIKNGNLGRTSHHCIHGNFNKNLLIENVNCYDFATHGIQLNGFDGLTLRNVDVGPSNNEQYLASEYTHYRFILPRLRKIAENNPTGTIQFINREKAVTMADIAEELEYKMTQAFQYVMYGMEPDEDDTEAYESFVEAKKIFVNDNGLGYGASQYGIFLSYPGANVLSFHLNQDTSKGATLENVNIHDLHHQTKEYVGIRTTLRLFVNSFNAPLHIQYLLGDEIFQDILDNNDDHAQWDSNYEYKGNIITDATLAMTELNRDDWGLNQIMYVLTDELTAWARGEIDGGFNGVQAEYLCAIDGMIHSAKGTFGLRIDGVDGVDINGLTISNIQEDSPMGYGICGKCTQCAFESRSPYQKKYTGNMVQGASIDFSNPLKMVDVTVDGIYSETGKARGIALWPGVHAEFGGDINVNNVHSGRSIDYDSLSEGKAYWAYPDVCGIQVYDEDLGYNEKDNDNAKSYVTLLDNANVQTQCVVGTHGCWETENVYTQVGDLSACQNEDLEDDGYYKSLNKNNITTMNNVDGNIFGYYAYYGIVIAIIAIFGYWVYMKQRGDKGEYQVISEQAPLMQQS